MKKLIGNVFLGAMLLLCLNNAFAQQQEADAFTGLRMNQLQLVGSHNSYKPGIEPALWKLIYA